MPSKRIPTYRHHKTSGLAVVTLPAANGRRRRDVFLGAYGSPESRERYMRVIADNSRTRTITDDMIYSIAEDRAGNLWFATRRHGACKYDPATGDFTSFRWKEGLKSRNVYAILEDRNGNIWMTTEDTGVWRLGRDGKTFTNYNGLVNKSVFSGLEDRDGNLWFGTRGPGLSRYDGKVFTTYSE